MTSDRKWKALFLLSLAIALLLLAQAIASKEPKRPRILGIRSVAILSSDVASARDFYGKLIAPAGRALPLTTEECLWCEKVPLEKTALFSLPGGQRVALAGNPANATNLLKSVVYTVDDGKALKNYLKARGVKFTDETGAGAEAGRIVSVLDPEGHQLLFVESRYHPPTGLRIIHSGFIVRDRAAMEHFYQDILGFRPYWHGGMKDEQTDWVSLQVPDGTDWVEFMVNVSENPDQRLRGIMNHIALGVPDIHAAREQLVNNGVHLTEEPKVGRDGKWQLNLYDPDLTRIEFMEFTPKEKPCCSEFTGPHPKP